MLYDPSNIIDYLKDAVERVTKAFAIINTDHKYIHEGIAYKAHLSIGDLAANSSISYSFKAPEKHYVHFKNFKLYGVGATLKMELIRGTEDDPLVIDNPDSGTIDGDDLVGPHSVNDFKVIETGVTIGKTPTYTTNQDGETWDQVVLPGSSTNQFQSSDQTSVSDNFEYVMKPDGYYVITIINTSSADAAEDVGLEMFWYEEDSA